MSDTPEHRATARVRGAAFARLILNARLKRGLTKATVVKRSGVSRSTYLRWEAGEATAPYPEHIRAVCRVLGVDHLQALKALGYLSDDTLTPAA
mgnify:CR=1 FL=1|jgi:transcriptional regulator with XRE-family HTH domain